MNIYKLSISVIFLNIIFVSNLYSQRNKKISFFEKEYSSTTKYSDGSSSSTNYNVKTFSLDSGEESEFGALQQKVGILGARIKPHLSLDPEVQYEFKTFKRKNSLQYIGIPIGFACFGVGLAAEFSSSEELTESQKSTKAYAYYATGVIIAGITYYIGVKSWDHLEKAITVHNKVIDDKHNTSYKLSVRPNLTSIKNTHKYSIGLGLRLTFG